MADFTKNSVADMAAANPGLNMGTTGAMHEVDWGNEGWAQADDAHWREQYRARPYARADREYDYYAPAYQYGATSSARHRDREWNDAESDLERGWDTARGKSSATWHDVKDAARDAWDRARDTTRGATRDRGGR